MSLKYPENANALVVGVPFWTPLGELAELPKPPIWGREHV